jgi:hypothetical protein
MARSLNLDELVGHWTLLDDEQKLIAGKRGPTRLGFALLLKFYSRAGRFPRGRGELPDEAVEFVARQVGVAPSDLGFYEWTGRTIEYHRAQIRAHLGFRECSVADADKLAGWLAANVCEAERRPELVRDELLVRCRAERIEPPAAGRIDRIVRSALHHAEQALTARIAARLPAGVAGRLRALVEAGVPDDDAGEDSVLALIKSVPGNVSLDSMLTEIRKLRAVRAIGLPAGLFSDVAPRVVGPAARHRPGNPPGCVDGDRRLPASADGLAGPGARRGRGPGRVHQRGARRRAMGRGPGRLRRVPGRRRQGRSGRDHGR